MLYFNSDYLEGAHPAVLKKLNETNQFKTGGYGDDPYTKSAVKRIKEACGLEEVGVFLLSGGTQTNLIAISASLHRVEAVISPDSGHIYTHEAGAIEAHGNKILPLPNHDGKISAQQVQSYMERYDADLNSGHDVKPGMVYISHPTEYGTLYSKEELMQLKHVCELWGLLLYIDGARLAYGITSPETDLDLKTLASLADLFYFGGTKAGALFGEALVLKDMSRYPYFERSIKQQGGLMAKGRILGIQFDALFEDNIVFKSAEKAVKQALYIKVKMNELGYRSFIDSPTNQQFFIVHHDKLKSLKDKVVYAFWQTYDENHTVIRLATSWATRDEDIEALLECFA